MADFTGFYFDNVHSSAYGLVRTSDGSRYTEGLIPEFEDREIELVGGDGSLYEGRRFKKTPFTVEVAFDHMTETQLRDLRQWLGTDELKPFRFDERPYKTYWVKPSRKPELTYICFMEEDESYEDGTYFGPGSDTHKIRIYKGEGKLEFTAYDPYGYCIDESTLIEGAEWKELPKINWQNSDSYNDFNEGGTNHISEWGIAVGLKDTFDLQNYNVFSEKEAYRYEARLYNPGDFETDFMLHIPVKPDNEEWPEGYDAFVYIYISQNEQSIYEFGFSIKKLTSKDIIVIDTKTHSLIVYKYLAEGQYQKTLRYDLVKSTDFPKIPIGESTIMVAGQVGKYPHIKYNYKFY